MTKEQKVMVSAPMPMPKQSLLRSFLTLSFLLFVFGAYYGIRYLRAPKEAAPMQGVCVEAPVPAYGSEDRDAKICAWRGYSFLCLYDPFKNGWRCDSKGPVLAEQK